MFVGIASLVGLLILLAVKDFFLGHGIILSFLIAFIPTASILFFVHWINPYITEFELEPITFPVCANCGYDLRESAGVCPECGEPFQVIDQQANIDASRKS